MRELSFEDKLFIDYRDNNSEEALNNLITNVSPWLYAIVISFVFDEDKTEDILDKVIIKMVKKKSQYKPEEKGIIYELFLIAKQEIFKEI